MGRSGKAAKSLITQDYAQQCLKHNPFIVLNASDDAVEGRQHLFTAGLDRFNLPELYICHDDADEASDALEVLAEQHMQSMLLNGFYANQKLRDKDGSLLVFDIQHLGGARLYTAALLYSQLLSITIGQYDERVFSRGLCQVLWPDKDNVSQSQIQHISGKSSSQLPPAVVFH